MIKEGMVIPLIFFIGFVLVLLYLMDQARKDRKFEIKSMPGLDAIDEAVGRASEMGRPIIANPGLGGLRGSSSIVTIAGISVATYVSRLAAKNGAKLIVPISDPEILPVVEENIKTSYNLEGVPEEFDPEFQIRWLGSSQWSWAAALQGIAEREQVASNIMIGSFAAEAMILAETFARVGAFQVGGLTNTYQIPFFVAACDYTLIGDEMLAAGAYLSGDQEQISTIAAEDYFKIFIVGLIILGTILGLVGSNSLISLLGR
jgi:hypothetical protein